MFSVVLCRGCLNGKARLTGRGIADADLDERGAHDAVFVGRSIRVTTTHTVDLQQGWEPEIKTKWPGRPEQGQLVWRALLGHRRPPEQTLQLLEYIKTL